MITWAAAGVVGQVDASWRLADDLLHAGLIDEKRIRWAFGSGSIGIDYSNALALEINSARLADVKNWNAFIGYFDIKSVADT
jgi:hypothetical protein